MSDEISIHVPTRGTTRVHDVSPVRHDFNPRAHEGHDANSNTYRQHLLISIHVPTRGTTVLLPLVGGGCYDFNPRAHEGHDPDLQSE